MPRASTAFLGIVKGLADAVLDHPKICGFCYTQLTDVEDNKVTVFHESMDAAGFGPLIIGGGYLYSCSAARERPGSAINEARITYDALSDAQKELIYAPQLAAAEAAYAEIIANNTDDEDAAAVALVEVQISAIGEVSTGSGPAIEVARQAYDALESRLQKKVSNYKDLQKAEAVYAELTAAPGAAEGGDMTIVIILAVVAAAVVAGVVTAIILSKKKKAKVEADAPAEE